MINRHHGKYCFCTDCCEARDCGCGPDEPDYNEWKKAFPNLEWNDHEKENQKEDRSS